MFSLFVIGENRCHYPDILTFLTAIYLYHIVELDLMKIKSGSAFILNHLQSMYHIHRTVDTIDTLTHGHIMCIDLLCIYDHNTYAGAEN